MMRRFFMQTLLLMTTVALQAQVFLFDEVSYAPTATTFKLFAPREAKKVVVRIYQDGIGGKAQKTVRLKHLSEVRGERSEVSDDLFHKL